MKRMGLLGVDLWYVYIASSGLLLTDHGLGRMRRKENYRQTNGSTP